MKLSIVSSSALFSAALLIQNTASTLIAPPGCEYTQAVGSSVGVGHEFETNCPLGAYIKSLTPTRVASLIVSINGICSDGSSISVEPTEATQPEASAQNTPDSSPQNSTLFSESGFGSLLASVQQTVAQGQSSLGVAALHSADTPTQTEGRQTTSCDCPAGTVMTGIAGNVGGYCSKLYFLCCNPTPYSSTGGVSGDPQFVGFLGQSFQVHGMDNTIYNIISTPALQFNALFTYLSKGECRQSTLCFSHPGNYFGKVGISIMSASGKTLYLQVEAGPVDKGMEVKVDGEVLLTSAKPIAFDSQQSLFFPSPFELYIQSNEYSIKLENSDMFLNQQVTINASLLKHIANSKVSADKTSAFKLLPHGVLGQTWRREEYDNRWKFIEGQLFDYIVSDGLNGNKFKYNRFQYN